MRWNSGWLLAHDTDRDNQPDHGPLYVGHGYSDKLIIQSSTGRRLVHFGPDGSASGSNLTLLFCLPSSAEHALSVAGVTVGAAGAGGESVVRERPRK